MKLKLLLFALLISTKCFGIKSADLFDDQPKILVNDGNLVFQSAESRNISIQLKGQSRFLVNNLDIVRYLIPEIEPNTEKSGSNTDAISSLTSQVAKLRSLMRGPNGILNRLDRVESGIPANASLPSGGSDRPRINALNRRVTTLEQIVANLTERLMRDHCKSYPCQNGGTCFNMFDTFRCECPENWEGPTCSLDVNECTRFAGTDLGCQNGATCFNTPGSYQCLCTDQWKGKNCNRNTVDCLQVPQSEICGHGTCVQVNSKLGYSCICEQGWRNSNITHSCTLDVDECTEMRPHCSQDPKVFCINTPGSFVCGPCPNGFTGNGFSCEDINECEINNGGCSVSPQVECVNTRGSYRCGNCPLGYSGDGRTCTPSSERPNQQCADSSICNVNAQCVQYPNGPPMCYCKPGYVGNGFGEKGCTASGLDPCAALRCKNGGTCINNGTSMYCACPPRTVQPFCDRAIDPCTSNPCLNGGNCTSLIFSRRYTCSCPRGFSGNNCQNQARRCGGLRNAENGTIKYPSDGSSTYYHNSRCAWLIKTNHTKVLNVTFQKFELEDSRDCKFDWLQIHDGRSSSSYMIGRFCGHEMPKGGNIISTHNQLYLWFRSDNSTAHDGFELSWESIDPVCGGDINITTHGTISSPGSPGNYPINRDCEWFITAPPGKRIQFLFYTLMIEAHQTCAYDYVEVHSGLGTETPSLGKYCNTTNPPPLLTPSHTATIHFHSDGDSNDAGFQIAYSVVEGIPGCGGTYTNARGDIVSPINIADGKYKHNIICEYVIQLPKDSRVRIEFKKFALEDSSSCKFDKLEIFEGSSYDEEYLIGRYCGENRPPIITSQTNIVTVKFTSDWSSNDDGFQFQYQLVCGGIFTADNGIISSPDYPSPYAGERNCEYDISAPQGKVIVLNVLDFDIEGHTLCEFDYLQIFDGFQADNATSLGRFCGQVKPGVFTSTYNHMHVHFSSDASINGRGFSANYSFVDVECGGIVKDASEVIKSPMDTDENGVYKSNALCRWLIYAPKGHVIQLNFINFELEHDTLCKYDYVSIYNNGSGMGGKVGPFCGTNAPKVITTTDNIATVVFQTDSSTAKDGFTISLSFIDGSKLCGGNYFSSQGVFRSPGKPEYFPNKECEWIITVPNGQQIELNFNYFDIEPHSTCRFDGLEVRNGGNKFAPLIGKFCGMDIPASIKSFSNQLFFYFYSDSSRGGKGFEIEWDGTSTGCGGQITSTKGSISSPNYPSSYAHNSQCEWRISVNEGSTIEIIFNDLDMETQSECKYDYLEIFDGSDASSRSFGKFCSSENHPMHLMTVGNHALIRMNTDDSHAGRGFLLKYSIHCNRTIHMDSGVIESPNFPNDYPNNLDCAWTIVVSKGNRINMQFSHFYLENDNQFHNDTNEHICKFDYVEIADIDFEKNTEKAQRLKYCNSAPEIRTSTGDSVIIVFHTDASASGSGFRMEWYVEGCGGKLFHPEGIITSPNYPKKYSHEVTCVWEINADYGYQIVATVTDLDIEGSQSCEYDYLEFSEDPSFNTTIMKMCHSLNTAASGLTSNGHKLYVKFNSDESNSGRGFNMTYRSVLSACGGKFSGIEGIITTPKYPTHNYENSLNCEWNIKTDKSHSLTFQFLDFDLEKSENCSKDYVEIYDPVFDNVLWKGCGNQMPNQTIFKSQRNELNVRLVTDNDITTKGFKGNFSQNCGARIITNDTGDFHYIRNIKENPKNLCTWTIISEDPAKKVTLTFKNVNLYFPIDEMCISKIEVFDGDSDQGSLKTSFCGVKTPPAITSNGNALTVKLNSTAVNFLSELEIHYSVMDNFCGGSYSSSIRGEFGSPNYPDSSPLNTFCIWTIGASAGNKISLTIKQIDIATSPSCNENYLEIRKDDQNGPLVGVYCGSDLPENLVASQKFWIKYKTDATTTSNGFLASFKYLEHSNLEGTSGIIESPRFPSYLTSNIQITYRITVTQGSLIRIEFPTFFMDTDDDSECFTYVKVFNGYDDTAPLLQDETCSDNTEAITSETNVVLIEFFNNYASQTRFQISWKEVAKFINNSLVESECSDKAILLSNETEIVNITSPGYPSGYGPGLLCSWTIQSNIPSFHPVLVFKDVDLEDVNDCIADYVSISSDREDGSWKEQEKLCSYDLRDRKMIEGTPNLKLQFKTDYGVNKTGFSAYTYLECGGKMTDSEGIIEYNTTNIYSIYRITNDCKWNITVRRGKTIQFEFLQLNIQNTSNGCNSYITIRNGMDSSSPYLGNGQYCGKDIPTIPPTSSNRAFVKYKVNIAMFNTFKLRYYEVQEKCGGQLRLLTRNSSTIISSPNHPNIPPPHVDCTWTIFGPVGERIRIDFLGNFDLTYSPTCDKEYVELRDGSTTSAQVIGTFCNEMPTTKKSRSNVMMVKFFTDVADPKTGFKANVSIDVCGGTSRSNIGYLTSPHYPGLGAYPSKAQCEYRISCSPNHIFTLKIIDIDLPLLNETECDKKQDHIIMYSIIPDFNSTGDESLTEIGTFCGNNPPNVTFSSDTNDVLVKFVTGERSKVLYKGFKIFYNATRLSCGGNIEGESGIITSPGYPTKTLNKLFCEWKITVPKGRRVKIEFLDVDLLATSNQFLQRIGVYNDFRYSNRLKFIANSSNAVPLYSSDNRMMVTMWVRTASNNRGFKLKFSSDSTTICAGSLNDEVGGIFPPFEMNLTSYTCDYIRELKPIQGDSLDKGTIAYYFKDISVGKKISNCRYASTVINVKRRSGENDDEIYLARICGNSTNALTVSSPFPDISIEVRQNPFFGQINFTMNYRNNKCGGMLLNGGVNTITNPPADAANYKIFDCAWFIKYEEEYSVSISIIKLNLKLSCDEEYVQIYNGPTALSPSIGKFCGTDFSKQVMVSQRNTIFIVYHTNNFVDTSKNSIFEIKLEANSTGCGGILNKNNFKFKTPLYDRPYPANTECVWEIRGDPGYHIGLSFYDRFFLEDSVNCTKDYVEVFDFVNEEWKSLGRRCGRDVPKPFNSTSETMRVVFHSDEAVSGDGFSAVWVQNCGGIFSVDQKTRVLSSPGYPKLYGPSLNCNYTFVAAVPKSFINLKFLDFAVETTGTKCMYDNITIYKNPDYTYSYPVTPEKVGTYCGVKNPGKFRHKDVSTIIFRSDRWVERKGFQIEYSLDTCGGIVNNSTMISSPKIISSTTYLGTLTCLWNITAPVGKKIIIKFENFTMENSDYCSSEYVELFNGTKANQEFRLAKICGNLTNTLRPIMINNNQAILQMKHEQMNGELGFSAAIYFRPDCDETITLTSENPSFVLDKSNREYVESRECIYRVIGEPLSTIKISFSELHLSICDPDRNTNECNCDFVEILDGNGPFSELIGRFCGHDLPSYDIISTRSAVYIRYVIDSARPSTGFKAVITMTESLCGSNPYQNFTGNETEAIYFTSPGLPKYPPNMRCMWVAEAPYGKIFEIVFNKFELEDSEMCSADSLTITDDSIQDSIPEGLGEEVIYRGKATSLQTPSFYSGIAGPVSPHVYCGNSLPHEYISQTHKIRINFQSNSEKEYAGFNFTIRTMKECARNYTSLQGRIVSASKIGSCKTFIEVPENYTISLYFHRFYFYESDCTKSFLKIYDGDFENGVLIRTLCGYAMPDPVFSTKNQLSLYIHSESDSTIYTQGYYDILYLATDQGRGCGGRFFNYGGIFSSPLYPNTNRTVNDCTWIVSVPQNLKVALKFATFDMGSKLMCESDYVEFIETKDNGEEISKKYCGEDNPAVYVSSKSSVIVHHLQTLNFAGTGWVLNFIGVPEGAKPQNW